MRLTPLVAVALLVLAVACGSDSNTPVASGEPSTTTTSSTLAPSTTAMPTETCSTAGIRVTRAEQDLPAAVAATRKAIFDAAVACDFDALAGLATDEFSYSFGDPGDGPAEHWRAAEANGTPVMKILTQVLNLPFAERELEPGQRYRSWPSADQEHRTAADWDALLGLYSEDEVARYRDADIYDGWRTGIRDGGQWMYFVAGD